MKKIANIIITFIISFIITYLIIGYVVNNFGVIIDWVPEVTTWDKLREYYIRTAPFYIKPTIIIAIIATIIISLKSIIKM